MYMCITHSAKMDFFYKLKNEILIFPHFTTHAVLLQQKIVKITCVHKPKDNSKMFTLIKGFLYRSVFIPLHVYMVKADLCL